VEQRHATVDQSAGLRQHGIDAADPLLVQVTATVLIDNNKFYSGYISGTQRLLDGNTQITEGADGRLFEVTPEHKLVWEYVSPYFDEEYDTNMVYRSCRYPYACIPQLDRPEETGIPRLDRTTCRAAGVSEE
jgi:hypothetical protein